MGKFTYEYEENPQNVAHKNKKRNKKRSDTFFVASSRFVFVSPRTRIHARAHIYAHIHYTHENTRIHINTHTHIYTRAPIFVYKAATHTQKDVAQKQRLQERRRLLMLAFFLGQTARRGEFGLLNGATCDKSDAQRVRIAPPTFLVVLIIFSPSTLDSLIFFNTMLLSFFFELPHYNLYPFFSPLSLPFFFFCTSCFYSYLYMHFLLNFYHFTIILFTFIALFSNLHPHNVQRVSLCKVTDQCEGV